MRWILVVLFLYIIPIWMVFKNYKNFKRSSIYASIYTVVVSVIVISNIYISTLNKIEEIIEYRVYASDEKYTVLEEDNKKDNDEKRIDEEADIEDEIEKEAQNIEFKDYFSDNEDIKVSDIELVNKFKDEIYEVERKALIPMRECMPDLKNIDISFGAIKEAKKDVEYAKSKCTEVVGIYEDMDIPQLSNEEHTDILESSKSNVKQAYILREKAMEASQELLNTKNLKYIGEIKEYLRLSDEKINSFVDSMKNLQSEIDN
ncbi:MAG: hypothetical protein ACRCXT_10845 [Paraclostridium sp.]